MTRWPGSAKATPPVHSTVGVASGNELGLSLEALQALSPSERARRVESVRQALRSAGADLVIDSVAELVRHWSARPSTCRGSWPDRRRPADPSGLNFLSWRQARAARCEDYSLPARRRRPGSALADSFAAACSSRPCAASDSPRLMNAAPKVGSSAKARRLLAIASSIRPSCLSASPRLQCTWA